MEPEKIEYVIKIKHISFGCRCCRDGEDDDSVLQDFIVDEDTVSPEDSASNQLQKHKVQEILYQV